MAKKKRSSFRDKVSADTQRQKTQASSYGYLNLPKGVNIFTAEPGGRMNFDIMPYEVTDEKHPDRNDQLQIAIPGELWYKRPFKTHRNIGVDNDTVVCPTSIGKPCPICEYRAKRLKEGADKDETDAMKASLRNLYVVIPIGHKKLEEKPHIWDISQYLFQNLLNDELEENEDNAVFPDLEEGLTLKVRFDSKQFGKGNPYAEASRIDFIERDSVYDEDILKDIPNLDEVLKILTYKQLEAKFFETSDEDLADEDDELEQTEEQGGSPKKSIRRKKTVTPPAPKEDEEDEEEEDEEDKFIPDDGYITCVACGGTGKNSKGKPCLACDGTGQIPEDEDEDEDQEEKPKPTRKAKPTKSEGKAGKNKCPHGHVFGKDCDDFDECDECEKWDECCDASEE